jgi:anti-sigma-K factor RskA
VIETPRRDEETLLRRYVLGQVSAEERQRIELWLLTEPGYLDELVLTEESLADEYARGELEGAEKEKFESYLPHSAELREDVEFTQALHSYGAKQTTPRHAPSAPGVFATRYRVVAQVVLACAAVLLAAVSILLLREIVNLREQVRRLQVQNSQADHQAQELANQLEQRQNQVTKLEQDMAKLQGSSFPGDSDTVSLFLIAGLSRGLDGTATATLSSLTKQLRLDLMINTDRYQSYQAKVQLVGGNIVWSGNDLQAHQTNRQRKAVTVTLPAAVLRGDYLVELWGVTPTGSSEKLPSYYFRVTRK